MEKHCPICNFVVKEFSEIKQPIVGKKRAKRIFSIHCHHCGVYKMAEECAKDFRRKYLSFIADSESGRSNYNENIAMLHDLIRHRHQDVLTEELIQKMLPLLHKPRM